MMIYIMNFNNITFLTSLIVIILLFFVVVPIVDNQFYKNCNIDKLKETVGEAFKNVEKFTETSVDDTQISLNAIEKQAEILTQELKNIDEGPNGDKKKERRQMIIQTLEHITIKLEVENSVVDTLTLLKNTLEYIDKLTQNIKDSDEIEKMDYRINQKIERRKEKIRVKYIKEKLHDEVAAEQAASQLTLYEKKRILEKAVNKLEKARTILEDARTKLEDTRTKLEDVQEELLYAEIQEKNDAIEERKNAIEERKTVKIIYDNAKTEKNKAIIEKNKAQKQVVLAPTLLDVANEKLLIAHENLVDTKKEIVDTRIDLQAAQETIIAYENNITIATKTRDDASNSYDEAKIKNENNITIATKTRDDASNSYDEAKIKNNKARTEKNDAQTNVTALGGPALTKYDVANEELIIATEELEDIIFFNNVFGSIVRKQALAAPLAAAKNKVVDAQNEVDILINGTEGFANNDNVVSKAQELIPKVQVMANEQIDLYGIVEPTAPIDFKSNTQKNNNIVKIDQERCCKSCCSTKQWPVPNEMLDKSIPQAELSEFTPTNFSCNFGGKSGCVCISKEQINYLSNRGQTV